MFTDTRQLAAKPSKRRLAQIDKLIEAAYYRVARGVQINVMDIGTIYREATAAALAGGDGAIEAAVSASVARLRKN